MLPWHNVPNNYNAIEEQGIDTFKTLKKKQKSLLKKGIDGSLLTQLKQNLKYLMSPVYLGSFFIWDPNPNLATTMAGLIGTSVA